MQFGVQFFPDVKPEQKAGAEYFREALTLAEEADKLGFTHIRIVEHYFHYYGGYSPNPMVFLAAAAQRTRQARLVTGAVLPAFNHPLKTRSAAAGSMSGLLVPFCPTSSAASAAHRMNRSPASAKASNKSSCC